MQGSLLRPSVRTSFLVVLSLRFRDFDWARHLFKPNPDVGGRWKVQQQHKAPLASVTQQPGLLLSAIMYFLKLRASALNDKSYKNKMYKIK